MSIGPYAAAGSAKASTRLQLAVVLFVILAPVAWMVLSSFKESADVTAIPRAWSSRRRRKLSRPSDKLAVLGVRAQQHDRCGGSTLLGLVLGVPAAFAISYHRLAWPANVLLAARMAPGTLYLLPWFVAFSALGLIGRYEALIVTHTVITMPMIVWVLLPYYRRRPADIYESALIDGAKPARILRS